MPDLSSQVLPRIEAHQMKAVPLGEDFVLPFYEGLSLVNIPGTISNLLGAPDFGKQSLDTSITRPIGGLYQKVILLLVDALGYQLLNRLMEAEKNLLWRRYLDKAVYAPLTSVCPSTTASALTTLWTGEGPSVHGIIGYEMWAKEYGMVINNILHSAASARSDVGGLARSGFDPNLFVTAPLFGSHLHNHGVKATTFIHSSIAHSGLSMMQMRDVEVNTFVDEADLCVSLAEHINRTQGVREYIYVYYSDVDTLMHRFTDDDIRVSLQFSAFSNLFENAFLRNLDEKTAEETLLLLSADHGSMATPKNARYELVNYPDLLDCFVMQPTCENRLAFFYIKPGRMQDVRTYFEKTWPGEFALIDPDDALEQGLFGKGPFDENARERLGDLIAAARGDAYLWWAPKPNHMEGRHGGLSKAEMLVPFYALPLDRLD